MSEIILDIENKIKHDNSSKKNKLVSYEITNTNDQESDSDNNMTQDNVKQKVDIQTDKNKVDWSDLNELIRKKVESENLDKYYIEKFMN